jgi:hypothetical protein
VRDETIEREKMSITAYFKTVCDGCGKTGRRKVELNPRTGQGIMEESSEDWNDGFTARAMSYASDLWSWGCPEGWIQVAFDEPTAQHYLFFHDGECYKAWLRTQDRLDEVKRFENAVWIA